MFKNIGKKLGKEEGFTIIEVLIVLAIAGLILVVVLLAIPQLQRNQRNEARRSVATRIVTEINNFAGNNNGDYPASSGTAGPKNLGTPNQGNSFFGRYLGCTNTAGGGGAGATAAECTANIDDPSTGYPVGTGVDGINNANEIRYDGSTVGSGALANQPSADAGSLLYMTNRICDGEIANSSGATARNFVFSIRLEGGAVACFDNR